MKKKFQKAAAVILAVSMAVGLAACGKQTEQTGGAGTADSGERNRVSHYQ